MRRWLFRRLREKVWDKADGADVAGAGGDTAADAGGDAEGDVSLEH